VKDPNKPLLRLYDIPDNTFDTEESSDESEEGSRAFSAFKYKQ
jgi:hypothetical protein